MNRLLILLYLLYGGINASAQNIYRRTYIIDSIYHNNYRDTSESSLRINYELVADSITAILVKELVDKEIADEKYVWPSGMIADTSRLSPTYRYLLRSKYKIAHYDIRSGCVWEPWWDYHDSLAYTALQKKWGTDFFTRSKSEAALLDKNGRGLVLPAIKHPDSTVAVLMSAFAFVDTPGQNMDADSRRYMMFEFHGGKIISASICRNVFGSIQVNYDLGGYTDQCTEIARKLNWRSPRFDNRPISISVVLDMTARSLYFYQW